LSSLSTHMHEQISTELALPIASVQATLELLDDGATVPFVARYRKERTGSLDEEQIRAVRDRATYLRKLEERKETVLRKIEEQGKLTAELRQAILACTKRVDVEDLYLPFKQKKRTRASAARQRGLEPLALLIGEQRDDGDPRQAAEEFIDADKQVPDVDAALAGARDILAEAVAERGDVRSMIRDRLRAGELTAQPAHGEDLDKTKFKDYASFREPVAKVKPHRYLAVCRGESEKKLKVDVDVEREALGVEVARMVGVRPSSPWAGELETAVREGLTRLVLPAAEREVRGELRERAEDAAIDVFAMNLRDLLMASPLGAKPVVGVDPGLRTGCKVAVVDGAGALVEHTNVPLAIESDKTAEAASKVRALADKISAAAVAVGTGTGGREAFAALRGSFAEESAADVVPVNESGASVYSASKLAKQEMPDVDVTVRGAVSIARRLQDPLSELVKIDPRSIGVGQYQHDVDQKSLRRRLDDVVETCVNVVGVDLNTASPSLLRYVAGIGPTLAKRVVGHREDKGRFAKRKDLLDVQGLGPKVFEQAAGFLRIRESEHPLDNSAVHPERYELVAAMAKDLGVEIGQLAGNQELAKSIDISKYESDEVGRPTLEDIVTELCRPGRDPRAGFEAPAFRDDVRKIEDLQVGMEIEGVVTNVTDFGAFVDVGVHQDGLVHISELADRFVSDPREVVRVGQHIKVRVIGVDLDRTRISLSGRSPGAPKERRGGGPKGEGRDRGRGPKGRGGPKGGRREGGRESRGGGGGGGGGGDSRSAFKNNPFADLLNKLGK